MRRALRDSVLAAAQKLHGANQNPVIDVGIDNLVFKPIIDPEVAAREAEEARKAAEAAAKSEAEKKAAAEAAAKAEKDALAKAEAEKNRKVASVKRRSGEMRRARRQSFRFRKVLPACPASISWR